MGATKHNWLVHSFDFTAAYLNALIEMEVWIKLPDKMNIPAKMGCCLKKALYGTKQAGRCWWEHLRGRLKALGFLKSAFDNSIYFNIKTNSITWIHIDDGIIIAQTIKELDNLKQGLKNNFMIKWKDGVESMIGMEVQHQEVGFTLNQKRLIKSIVVEHWDGKKTNTTPLPAKRKVSTLTQDEMIINQKFFLSIVGSLSYIANGTRPDISFVVNLLAQHAQAPGHQHLLGYLQHTQGRGLKLFPNNEDIMVSSDASWGGEFSRLTHGYLMTVHGCAISWSSKRLTTVASSPSHTEYMALSLESRQGMWLKRLIKDVFGNDMRLLLLCNNESAIRISKDSASKKRTRQLDRDFYIVNKMLYNKEAELDWVFIQDMKANGIQPNVFESITSPMHMLNARTIYQAIRSHFNKLSWSSIVHNARVLFNTSNHMDDINAFSLSFYEAITAIENQIGPLDGEKLATLSIFFAVPQLQDHITAALNT
ncbi:hypothetical protein O181_028918 [Austropuccinia psidii MF-1]|uniref:Reverse transcriptase Ty1/copia-type domain-containing protein n=1 Tax=Austropuccinia psidii MF-1 TaxID=1389203 RepID=A0A9Q3H2A3_9BASI|nr:hypothetical protein [Austropuccinia psidii MF-1]